MVHMAAKIIQNNISIVIMEVKNFVVRCSVGFVWVK